MGAKKIEVESLWDINDVMLFLKLGRSKVKQLTSSKDLPSRLIGGRRRYLPEDVRKWVKKQK